MYFVLTSSLIGWLPISLPLLTFSELDTIFFLLLSITLFINRLILLLLALLFFSSDTSQTVCHTPLDLGFVFCKPEAKNHSGLNVGIHTTCFMILWYKALDSQ